MLNIKNNIGSLPEGLYVWKKYGTTSKYVENSNEFYRKVLTTEPQNGAITYERSSTYTFDESTGLFTLGTGNSGSIAYGSYGKIDTPSDYYMIGTRTGTTMYKNDGTAQVPDLYNNAGGVIILAYNDSHLVTEYQSELIYEKSDFIDFVVSDQETAYPDGGEQGGYWYEKSGGGCKTYTGSITLASSVNSIEIANPLGNKDNVKAVFLSCFTSNSFGRSDTVYYNIDTNMSLIATYAGREKDVELTVTNDNITIKNTSRDFDKQTYNWEVIGYE